VSLGRAAKPHSVDFDLALEGPAAKVSRRQGTIKLRPNGDFYVHNEGKRAFFVDGKPVLPNHKYKLHDNVVIQICRFIRLVFRVNEDLVGAMKDRAREVKETKDAQKKQQKKGKPVVEGEATPLQSKWKPVFFLIEEKSRCFVTEGFDLTCTA
jgi:pSer/pThr/pTyr-binding forkhead associated (FHA) protein